MIDRLLGWTVHKMSTIFMIRYSSFPMKMALMTEVSRRKIEKYIKKPTVTSLFVIDWLLQFAWILLYFLLETLSIVSETALSFENLCQLSISPW